MKATMRAVIDTIKWFNGHKIEYQCLQAGVSRPTFFRQRARAVAAGWLELRDGRTYRVSKKYLDFLATNAHPKTRENQFVETRRI
jgi:hypothetical protein